MTNQRNPLTNHNILEAMQEIREFFSFRGVDDNPATYQAMDTAICHRLGVQPHYPTADAKALYQKLALLEADIARTAATISKIANGMAEKS